MFNNIIPDRIYCGNMLGFKYT